MSANGINMDIVNMVKCAENFMRKKFVKNHHVKSCVALTDIQYNVNILQTTSNASLIPVLSCKLSIRPSHQMIKFNFIFTTSG